MKKIILIILSLLPLMAKGQELNFSAALSSRTPALFAGSWFSKNPAVSVTAVGTYKGVGLFLWRSQDLVDSKSSANFLAVQPFWKVTPTLQVGAEVDLFPQKESNLLAPYIIYSREIGGVNLSLMGGFAHFFESGEKTWIIRPSLEKKFGEFSLQLYGWGVKTPQQMLYKGALGVSRELLQNLTLQGTYLVEKGSLGALSLELKYSF